MKNSVKVLLVAIALCANGTALALADAPPLPNPGLSEVSPQVQLSDEVTTEAPAVEDQVEDQESAKPEDSDVTEVSEPIEEPAPEAPATVEVIYQEVTPLFRGRPCGLPTSEGSNADCRSSYSYILREVQRNADGTETAIDDGQPHSVLVTWTQNEDGLWQMSYERW